MTFVLIAGCTPAQNNGEDRDGYTDENKIRYKEIKDTSSLPKNVEIFIQSMKKQRGFTNFRDENTNILVISSGEKTTGGYGIDVESVKEVGGIVEVVVKETTPEKGSVVTEVLTYPFIILKMPMTLESFKVINTEGEEFTYIPSSRLNISENGIYVGQIDNNFVEIKINGESRTFMLTDETRETIEELGENRQIEFTYYINENNQLVVTYIKEIDHWENASKTETGTYVGQIDNFSIEVTIDGKAKAFINYEMDRLLKDIKEGDKVEVKYSKNKQGQLELIRIEKTD
jgi:sporulation protein YlmC with PRC-barrel domain